MTITKEQAQKWHEKANEVAGGESDYLQAFAQLAYEAGKSAVSEPVLHQFQTANGKWCDFLDDDHYQNTVEDGRWPIRALYTTPPAEAKPQWMPIETAMPEPMIPVLVCNGKQIFIEQWWGEDFTFDHTITHWMPLPLPPTASST